MPEPHPTARGGRTFAVPAAGPEARRLRELLIARWRANPNGAAVRGNPAPLWGVCPLCREEALGTGSWADGSLRVSCWACGALEEDVAAVLGVAAPDSRADMLARLDRVIATLERQVGKIAEWAGEPLRRVGIVSQRLKGPRL